MIQFLGKLWRDRRGNALIIAGAALPLLVGAAGLGTDTVQWVLWKRELQRAADTAALAGAYAELQTAAVPAAVAAHLSDNNHTGIALLGGYPAITYPADVPGSYTKAVKVELRMQRTLGFSSLFLSTAPTIKAEATAALVQSGSYCVVGLNSTTAASITIGGSASVSMGCGAISDSTSTTASVATNGATYNFTADPVAGVGAMPTSIIGATDIQAHHAALPDPYASKYSTSISGMTCNKQVNPGSTALTPGCYKSFKFTGNTNYTLAAGTYYLDSTNFDVQGTGSITGTGVTIILTGATPGDITTNGNTTIKLSAPTSGTYANMLFIGNGSSLQKINGNNGSFYDGAMYFPNGTAQFLGSSNGIFNCAMVVANYVDFSGNASIQNTLTHPDGSACQAATQVQGKAVRLIA
jgi:Flp pilus assembly protein TadG